MPKVPKVLVVDPEPDLVRLISYWFERMGWQVESASDGVEALEKLRSFRPDAMTLETGLLKLDGLEVLETMRSWAGFDRSPVVVVVTAHGDTASLARARDLGVARFIIKPFDPERLAAHVQAAYDAP